MESSRHCLANRPPITHGRLMDFPDDTIACMRALQQTHGNIAALQEESQRLIFVFGPEWNQRVLSDSKTFHSRFFAVRGPRKSAQRRVTSGLLSMNGEEHKQHRRMVMGPFQKKTIAHYHESICQLTQEMLDDWSIGQVRDMHEEMTQYMLRVTSGILFGLDIPDFAYKLGGMIDEWVHMNHAMGMGAFVSDASFTENYDALLGQAEALETNIQQMIHLRRRTVGFQRAGELASSAAGNGPAGWKPTLRGEGTDVLSLLIRAHEEEGRVNDSELVGHIALLFGAAHLTTAHTLTWTLFLLAQHPSVMREVVDEITGSLAGSAPTPDEAAQLPLTERVLKESMRVLPASSYSQRVTAEPVELGPFRLSAGAGVVFSQFITHHLEELYPEPERFRPERWLSISPSPYAYLPFGAGPRMCLGGPLAMMILKTALPMILKRYRLSVTPGAEISGKVISTMLGPTTSVPMLVSPQDGRFQSSPVSGNIHTMVQLPEAAVADTRPARRAA